MELNNINGVSNTQNVESLQSIQKTKGTKLSMPIEMPKGKKGTVKGITTEDIASTILASPEKAVINLIQKSKIPMPFSINKLKERGFGEPGAMTMNGEMTFETDGATVHIGDDIQTAMELEKAGIKYEGQATKVEYTTPDGYKQTLYVDGNGNLIKGSIQLPNEFAELTAGYIFSVGKEGNLDVSAYARG